MAEPGRWVGLLGAILGMVGLMAFWMRLTDAGVVGSASVMDHAVGSEVVLSLLTVLEVRPPDRLVVGHAGLRVTVWAPIDGVAVGDELTVGGIVVREGLRATFLTPAPHRAAKKRLSLLGLAVAAALAGSATRIEAGGFARRG